MKTRIILACSILLNLGLFGAWMAMTRTDAPAPVALQEVASRGTKPTPTLATGTARPIVVPDDFNWSEIESEDYKQYIANLRAIGCPEDTIRDIIIADVNKLYAGKERALWPSPKDFKFWEPRNRNNRDAERAREKQLSALQAEKRELIRDLLGVDIDDELAKASGRPDGDSWRYGFLSPEKQEEVKALTQKFREQQQALFADGGGRNPENRAKMTALRAEMEAQLAKSLSPAEYEEYQLRNSFTARSMRETLTAFTPSENEFKEIFRLQKGFDDQFGFVPGGGDDTVRQQREAAQHQLDEQMRSLLGADRYKQYELSQDSQYRDQYDYAQSAKLPTDMAEKLYDARKLADAERQRLRNDTTIPADQRQVLLAALAESTGTILRQTLGEESYAAYTKNDAGRWVNQLTSGGGGNQNRGGGPRGGGFRGGRGGPGGP